MAVASQVSEFVRDHRLQPSARLFRAIGIEAGETYDGGSGAAAGIAEHGCAACGCQRPPRDEDLRRLARPSEGGQPGIGQHRVGCGKIAHLHVPRRKECRINVRLRDDAATNP